jgi:molybdate transport system ATP-binding protein
MPWQWLSCSGSRACWSRKPSGLSGGEAQRVAIGRALLSKPRLLMMDEPLAGLDQARKADVLALIEKVRDVVGVPILYVSHAREEVLRLAGHVAIIADGRCVDQGSPDNLLGGRFFRVWPVRCGRGWS